MGSKLANHCSRFRDQKVAQHKRIHLRAQKTIERFFGPAHDWLVVVEGGVEHDGNTRGVTESANQLPVARIGFSPDGLQAAGSVDVRRRRNLFALFRAHGIRERHERRGMRFREPLARGFREDGWRERAEDFAVLDSPVQNLFHLHTPRVSDDAPVAERSRTPFSPALKPSKDFAIGDDSGRATNQFFLRQFDYGIAAVRNAARADRLANLRLCKSRPPISVIHHKRPRLPKNLVPDVKRSADGEPRIACGGLDVNFLEWRRLENFSVVHSIDRHSACQTHCLPPRAFGKFLQHAEIDFLKPRLQRCGKVAVPLLHGLFRLAPRAEPPRHSVRKKSAERWRFAGFGPAHLRAGAVMNEVGKAEPKTVALGSLIKLHDLPKRSELLWLAVR